MASTSTEEEERQFDSIFQDPVLVDHQGHPLLLIHDGKEKQDQIFYSVSKQGLYKRKIPELCNAKIWASSSHGWLVIEHPERAADKFSLLNPFTKERVQLPELTNYHHYWQCFLSSPPSDHHNCRVTFIDVSTSSIATYQLGDHQQQFGKHEFHGSNLHSMVCFKGKIYCMTFYRLALIDFSGSTTQLVEIITHKANDESMGPLATNGQGYLVESCGELLLVNKHYYGLHRKELLGFSIFRADLQDKEWVKLDDIGHRAIFLDEYQGMSVSTTPGEDGLESSGIFKSNCIYFTDKADKFLYVFDLENQRILTCLPSPEVDARCGSTLSWVMMPRAPLT